MGQAEVLVLADLVEREAPAVAGVEEPGVEAPVNRGDRVHLTGVLVDPGDRGPLGDREDVHRVVGRVLVVRELVRGVHRLRLPGAVDDGHSLGGATVMWFRGRRVHVVTAITGAL